MRACITNVDQEEQLPSPSVLVAPFPPILPRCARAASVWTVVWSPPRRSRAARTLAMSLLATLASLAVESKARPLLGGGSSTSPPELATAKALQSRQGRQGCQERIDAKHRTAKAAKTKAKNGTAKNAKAAKEGNGRRAAPRARGGVVADSPVFAIRRRACAARRDG